MKNLGRTAGILSLVVGITGGAAVLVVGCGGDDTVVGYPGVDSGPDVVTSDTGTDTGSDASDSGTDSGFHFDAGNPDFATFAHQIDITACSWAKNCCGTGVDFNATFCTAELDNDPVISGFVFTRPLKVDIDGGQATLDEAKATDCLNKIQKLSCGQISSADFIALRDACYGAIVGDIATGDHGCRRSWECQAPGHCEIAADGGGTCTAPHAADAPCTSYDQCGQYFSGVPRYCALGPTGDQYGTALNTQTCLSPQANGSLCNGPEECTSWVCDYDVDGGGDHACRAGTSLISDALCTAFPTPDGG